MDSINQNRNKCELLGSTTESSMLLQYYIFHFEESVRL